MHRWSAILALLAPAVLTWPAAAQDYPTRPIRAIASKVALMDTRSGHWSVRAMFSLGT